MRDKHHWRAQVMAFQAECEKEMAAAEPVIQVKPNQIKFQTKLNPKQNQTCHEIRLVKLD